MKTNENMKQYSLPEIPYFKIHGRIGSVVNPLPLFANGSAVELNVTGTELSIDLEVDYDQYEPWAGCSLNGSLMSRQMLPAGRYELCLFRGLSPDSVKNVKFFRELQAMSEDESCHILVHGFSSDGFFLPVSDQKYKLEFIGDSITSGEGTYGAREDVDWVSMYMSVSHNYADMVSKRLGAEYHLLSQGGWGVLSSWDGNPACNIPSVYEQVSGLSRGSFNESLGAGEPYRFEKWQPDAVIINLGTNDQSAFEQPAFTDASGAVFDQKLNADGTYDKSCLERFQTALINFLTVVRKHNPGAPIVWVYGMLGYKLTLPITDAICSYKKASGDENITFLQLPNITQATVGSHGHPGKPSHQESADILANYLEELLH